MKVVFDLDVLLDVIQERMPHYESSALVLTAARTGALSSAIPSHGITTIYYIVKKYDTRAQAEQVVDWLLKYFMVLSPSTEIFLQARSLQIDDYEDAVVASLALNSGTDYIITRNLADYQTSPVPALSPQTLLDQLSSK